MPSLKTKVMSSLTGAFCAIGLFASQASAVPSLQLYIDPAVNPGAFYDGADESWVFTGNAPFTLTLFALDSDLGSEEGDAFTGTLTDAILSVSLKGLPAGSTGDTSNSLGSLTVGGNSVTNFTYGEPPAGTVMTNDGGGDLPPHGIFPTWFAEYGFNFGAISGVPNVFDAQPPVGAANKTGFRKDFLINLSGLSSQVTAVHFDLYTLGAKNPNSSDSDIYANAPFSHDAEAVPTPDNPVPEPATVLLMGAGLAAAAGFRKKSVRS